MSNVPHQPNLAAQIVSLWCLPYELAAGGTIAAAEIMTASLARHGPRSPQLPIPEPIEADDEHNLFA